MSDYTPEQYTVAEAFRQSFGRARPKPLLLYGLGRNTEAILDLCPEIEIAGVMGLDAGGTSWHGKPVVLTEEAARLGADIVIVARNAVVPIIYQRIAALEARGVRIYRVNGQPAAAQNCYDNESLPYWDETFVRLKDRIDSVSFVSFDIFDTLLARRVLHPEDIFGLLERSLPWAAGFRAARARAQQELGPTAGINQLYDAVRTALNWTPKQTQAAMETEWRLECETVYPRGDMIEALHYAETRGKRVWLLTDMYWPETRLRKLLAQIGAATAAPMIVSCETGCSKEDGALFREYLRRSGAKASDCLHIGDNRYADIQSAEREGIAAARVYSGYSLLEESAAQRLLNHEQTSPLALGEFVASRFSSPFSLHQTRGRLPVETPYELGYSFIGPLVDFWLDWLCRKLKESDIQKMLFPARDGYLLHSLYEQCRRKYPGLPPGIYFKASRRAVSVASIRTEDDVRAIADRVFHGTAGAFFGERFGIRIEDDSQWETGSAGAESLLSQYMPMILQNAENERNCYLRYLDGLGLTEKCLYGFTDFVAGGTVQHFYEKLTGCETRGFYFATMNLPNAFYQEGDIAAPFGNITSYGDNPLAEGYLMLESVLTDPDTTLVRLSEDGKPFFAAGQNAAWPVMKQVQKGIGDYVEQRVKRDMPPASREVSLAIWNLLFDGSCVISPKLRERFRHEDSYDGAGEELCWQEAAEQGTGGL